MRSNHTLFTILFTLCWAFVATVSAKKAKKSTTENIYGKHRLITYIVDWEVPKDISWDKFDHVAYAFAEPDKDGKLQSFTSSNLKSVVSKAHDNKIGVSISVGGWSGSRYFSSLVASDSKRKTLVNNIVSMVDEYGLDGVNLDWEYPNNPDGLSCNERNAKDTANYLQMVKDLRKSLNTKFPKVHKLITIAVGTSPFNDENEKPIKSLDNEWATQVDSYYLMTYDISGDWNEYTGPNSPLKPGKWDSSVQQAVQAWNEAGIPKDQLVVGVPFYGTAMKTSQPVTGSSITVKLAKKSSIKGDKYDERSADECTGATVSSSGSYQWRSIKDAGIMKNENGWKVFWDKTSVTPYAYHAKDKKFLTFDNAKSIKKKADYVVDQHLGGAMIWSLEMDDSKNTLLSSLQTVRN